ncbi:hypothetical protein EVA_08669 [gut metagenome]|uniref:Uncharacterized protein n=1 Tax=gut metagenome TaxID=749906 RepID=J9CSP7_9ZZZZ
MKKDMVESSIVIYFFISLLFVQAKGHTDHKEVKA